jgi:hypothetical protein
MADLVIFGALVGLIGAAGIALGMLAARRLAAREERRVGARDAAGAAAVPEAWGSGAARDVRPLEDGGETID